MVEATPDATEHLTVAAARIERGRSDENGRTFSPDENNKGSDFHLSP
jgi:hypothetical protein